MRLYKLVLTSIASAALVACGGGGAGSSATTIVIPRNLVPYSEIF